MEKLVPEPEKVFQFKEDEDLNYFKIVEPLY